MGILNVTPDSFFDGGKHDNSKSALTKAVQMLEDGADIIDVGGQSTRPGAQKLSSTEEWQRIEPVLKAVRKEFKNCVISCDTFYSDVAYKAVQEGADIINDVSAGKLDDKMFETVAKLQVPYIVMHMQGSPENMQEEPQYAYVVAEVLRELSQRIQDLKDLGLNDIIVDPGFGFGKSASHNFELLKNLKDFKILELPLLIGISRKRMINETLNIKAQQALNGTTALHAFALERGVNILRVHDVKEAKEVVTLYQTMNA